MWPCLGLPGVDSQEEVSCQSNYLLCSDNFEIFDFSQASLFPCISCPATLALLATICFFSAIMCMFHYCPAVGGNDEGGEKVVALPPSKSLASSVNLLVTSSIFTN